MPSSNDFSIICQLCNKAGHIAKACHSIEESFKSFSAMTLSNPSESNWYPGSVAIAHMTPNPGQFDGKSSTPLNLPEVYSLSLPCIFLLCPRFWLLVRFLLMFGIHAWVILIPRPCLTFKQLGQFKFLGNFIVCVIVVN
ncbi:hypothetical protein ACH5RR_008943 [Cinchona calisaya]|uniref:CCHC-type domain-containing protein n=1 Tax=Cinchona calisaya TaxID=153742 RepID=A0ABD3ACS1_9GENT